MCNEKAAALTAGAVHGTTVLAAHLASRKIINLPDNFKCCEELISLYYSEAASLLQRYQMPNIMVPVVRSRKPRNKRECQKLISEIARCNAYKQFMAQGWLIRDKRTCLTMLSETAKSEMKLSIAF